MKINFNIVQKQFSNWLDSLLVIGFLLLMSSCVQAADFQSSPLTNGLSTVVDLQGVWVDAKGNRHVVPFNYLDRRSLELFRDFDLPAGQEAGQDLYLYFEGLAWTAEVYLNDRLLKVTRDPFAEHLLPLKAGWLQPKGNQIRVVLHRSGLDFELYPDHFTGIFRQVNLLVASDTSRFLTGPVVVEHAPRAVVIAPWRVGTEYLYDFELVKACLQGVFAYPEADPVYFPFRPSNQSLNYIQEKGFQLLEQLEGADSLAFYNSFPVNHDYKDQNPSFWRGTGGRPTRQYGHYSKLGQLNQAHSSAPNRPALLILLLVPALALLIIKLVDSKFYASLPEFLSKSKIYLELIGKNKFLKTEHRLLLNLVRLLIIAAMLSLYSFYILETGAMERLNLLSSVSYLHEFLKGDQFSPYQIFVFSFLVFLGLTLLKYFFLNLASRVYRVQNFSQIMQNLDIYASFPLIFLTIIPAPFIFFSNVDLGNILIVLWYVFFGIYYCRRLWVIYSGLNRLFRFSISLKILYVCTLEILPWIFLL